MVMLNTTIQDRLTESFHKYSNKTIIEYGDVTLTYKELYNKSSYFKNWIISNNIKQHSHIGIILDDRINLIASIIGILMAGCVFVPLEPSYPINRLYGMMEEIDTSLIITDRANSDRVMSCYVENNKKSPDCLIVENSFFFQNNLTETFDSITYSNEDPIYIYFTSGTTGKPKPIIGVNKSLVHFIDWEIDTFNINENTKVSQFASPSFDAFLRDLFVPLLAGGIVCIPSNLYNIIRTGDFVNWLEMSRINLLHCTPSLFKIFKSNTMANNNLIDLQLVLMAGERLRVSDIKKWYDIFGDRIQIVNMYGPTETTMIKTFYCLSSSDVQKYIIPIGKPIIGTKIYIMDNYLKICAPGEIGEIYIDTQYSTLGYYNSEIPDEKFVMNPINNGYSNILYKTGDLGRILDDGNIEFYGRIDRQVKVRGIRIELEEIENEILTVPGVKETTVIFMEGEHGDPRLMMNKNDSMDEAYKIFISSQYYIAYYTSFYKVDPSNIVSHLRNKLPNHMIPNYLINISAMPLTCNGKLDYNALPLPIITSRK